MIRFLSLVALVGLAVGCDSAPADEFVARPVLSSVFEAGEPMGHVRLTRLALLNTTYDPATQAIRDARVDVTLVGAGGEPDTAIPFRHIGDGVYAASPLGVRVLAGRTYRVAAVVPAASGAGRDTLRAQTTVPPAIRVVEAPAEAVTYGDGIGPPVRLTTSSTADRRAVYIFAATAQQADEFEEVTIDGERRWRQLLLPGRFGLVPTQQIFNDCERDAQGRDVCGTFPDGGRSPLLNEDNYEILGDGTARVNIPFIGFAFYGPQVVTFYSLDDALVDFVETQTLQANPTTISPGEIPNVTTNVENGLGVFGSIARAEVALFVRPPGG